MEVVVVPTAVPTIAPAVVQLEPTAAPIVVAQIPTAAPATLQAHLLLRLPVPAATAPETVNQPAPTNEIVYVAQAPASRCWRRSGASDGQHLRGDHRFTLMACHGPLTPGNPNVGHLEGTAWVNLPGNIALGWAFRVPRCDAGMLVGCTA
ncbi:MAG: hypothetical protein U0694_25075 [Anaerolineae bacterium]